MGSKKLPGKGEPDDEDDRDPGENTDPDLLDLPLSDIDTRKVEWLMPDRIIRGAVAFLQGPKGAGKSTLIRAIIAHVTGGPRLPGTGRGKLVPGNVLYYVGEESLHTRVKPCLIAAGADPARVFCASALADGEMRLRLPTDCDRLERRIRSREAKLVVIDPIFAFTDGSGKMEKGTEDARSVTGAIMAVADKTKATILLSRNLTKGTHKSAIDAGRGSGELGNAARSVLHTARLPNQDVCAFAVAICNEGKPVPALLYRIVEKQGCSVVEWAGESDITADELSSGEEGEIDRSLLENAKKLLIHILLHGEEEGKIVKKIMEDAGFNIRTTQVSAKRLKLRYRRTGSRKETKVFWRLPKGMQE